MEQECLKSVTERRQRNVWCTQFNRKTVPHPRSLDSEAAAAVVCSGAWNSQWASERIEDATVDQHGALTSKLREASWPSYARRRQTQDQFVTGICYDFTVFYDSRVISTYSTNRKTAMC